MNIPTPPRTTATTEVRFTRRQYEYLNRVFGELIGNHLTTEAELRVAQGARRVVQHVKGLVDGNVQ